MIRLPCHFLLLTVISCYVSALPLPTDYTPAHIRVRRQLGGFDINALTGLLSSAIGSAGEGILDSTFHMLADTGLQTVKSTVADSIDMLGENLHDMIRNMDGIDLNSPSPLNLFNSPSGGAGSNPLLNLFGGGNIFDNLLPGLPAPPSGLGNRNDISADVSPLRRKRRQVDFTQSLMNPLTVLANSVKLILNAERMGNGPPSLIQESLDANSRVVDAEISKLTRIAQLLEELQQQMNLPRGL